MFRSKLTFRTKVYSSALHAGIESGVERSKHNYSQTDRQTPAATTHNLRLPGQADRVISTA